MEARLCSWWQKVRKPLEIFVAIVGCILVIALLVVIALAYIFNLSIPGLRGKTLWDWLQLLIIPAVLAIGGYLFNFTTSRNERLATEQRVQIERKAAAKRDRTERVIALDNQNEEALQSYIDKMSELLLEKKLRDSKGEDEVRTIARVRTLTVLPRLDKERKRSVLQFLHESGLIDKNRRIIELSGADLGEAYLQGANLKGSDLSKADLCGNNRRVEGPYLAYHPANMRGVHLNGANLSGAFMVGVNLHYAHLESANLSDTDLEFADLSEANLTGVDLSGAKLFAANLTGAIVTNEQLSQARTLMNATMPDGSIHP
jgi:uncharacterized protein YjbI with pentapeptide repeats